MKNILLFFVLINPLCLLLGQTTYTREWGTLIDPVKFGSNHVLNVNPVNGNMYYVSGYLEIMEYNINNYQSKSIYKFQQTSFGTIIQNITFDTEGNIIISGRGTGAPPPTPGTYNGGANFIVKISTTGTVLLSLRANLSQHITHLALDKFNNMYCVGQLNKNTVLNESPFQSTADTSSIINSQDAITKISSNGQHVWSTFYTKDQSYIRSIVAADDGFYVYGDHMASTSTSNYFSTPGSYQEYATGVFTGSGGNEKNVFLSKFNFDGTRAWSTYFAVDRSMVPYGETLNYYGGLTVINNEPYILTKHEIRPVMTKNPTTAGAFLTTQVSMSQYDITATKFSNTGKKIWSTFLYYGEAISKPLDTNELFISGTAIENNQYLTSIVPNNAYQNKFGGGRTDNYIFSLSTDGSKMNYGTFYGGLGNDVGVTFATKNGFYTLGYTSINNSSISMFSTNPVLNQYVYDNNGKEYYGTYISYFKRKSLGLKDSSSKPVTFNIYPNPATNVLNIQCKDILPENTLFTVFNIAGKKVLIEKAQSTEVNQINISNLSAGVYVLKIDSNRFRRRIFKS